MARRVLISGVFPRLILALAGTAAISAAPAALAHDEDGTPHDHAHDQAHGAHGPVVQARDFDHAVRLIRDGLESLEAAVAAGDMHALHTLSDGVAFPARSLGKLAAARPGAAPANLRAINTLGQDLAKLVDAMHIAADSGKSDVVVAKWKEITPLRAQLDALAPQPRLTVSSAATPVAGAASAITLGVRGSDGAMVTAFEPVHGAGLHLFTVCPELVHFTHQAGDAGAGGAFTFNMEFPHAGAYTLLAVARPAGTAAPLVLRERLMVTGSADADTSALAADTETSKLVGAYLVRTDFPAHVHAGEAAELRFRIDERAAPGGITPEPLHGLPAFFAGVSADSRRLALASNIENPAPGSFVVTATFETPGLHATWLRFRHNGAEHAARFVIDVHGAGCDHGH